MLGVLVIVLGFDCVAGQGGGTRQLHVLRVARLCVDALIGLFAAWSSDVDRLAREEKALVSLR